MKATRIIYGTIRTLVYIIIGVLLLVAGLLITIYSPWGQDRLKDKLVSKLNSMPGTEIALDKFRLSFPLDLDLAGVKFVQQGDTMVMADTLSARIGLMPLLTGTVDIKSIRLVNGYYQMGGPDSLMYMKIKAGDLQIKPGKVTLSDMGISLEDGYIRNALIDMRILPDTSTVTTDSVAEPTDMKISIKHLRLEETTFKMQMLPTIDALVADIHNGKLDDGIIDMKSQEVKMKSFVADSLDALYIAPDSATISEINHLYPIVESESTSPPWTVMIDSIQLNKSHALYTTQGLQPQPGLDFGYIEVSDLDLTINNLYNQATTLKLPLRLHATERCGVTLDAEGTFAMDSTAMYFDTFSVRTSNTELYADGMMGVGDLMTDLNLPLRLRVDGYCGVSDMMLMFPDFKQYLILLPKGGDAQLALDLYGTPSRLMLTELSAAVPGVAKLNAKGTLDNIFSTDKLGCDLTLNGHIFNVKNIVKAFTTPDLGLIVPPMALNGNVHMRGTSMSGKLLATTMGGRVALDANLNGTSEAYTLDLKTDRFPVQAFMPDLGVGETTVHLWAKGKGLDILSPKATMDGALNLKSLVYQGYEYQDINFDAGLHNSVLNVNGGVNHEDLMVKVDATCDISDDSYKWDARITGDVPDLKALQLTETPMTVNAVIDTQGIYGIKDNTINATVLLPELYYKGAEDDEFTITDVEAKVVTNDSLIQFNLHNHDLTAHAFTPVGLTEFSTRLDSLMATIDDQVKHRKVDVDTLQRLLPAFAIDVTAGDDNLINDILKSQKMSINHLGINASNDTVLSLRSDILQYTTGATTLDTIRVNVTQEANKMHIIGTLDNRKGNMDEFAHIRADGLLNTDRLSLRIIQRNASDETGFDLGAITLLSDSVVTARLFPLSPMIGYKKWSVNLDNFIIYNIYTHNINANLKMNGANSSVTLKTEKAAANDSINNIILNINDIHLADWIAFNPFAPPITGNLSAQMNVSWDGGTNIDGTGQVSLTDFYYDRKKVSSMLLDMDVATNMSGEVKAKADLMVDGEKTMTLAGVLNDSESDTPFKLDFSVIKFPLATVNPFLPEDMAQLTGNLNGLMQVSGDAEKPILNGEIYFEKAAVKVAMTNTSYAFSDVKIPVVNNLVSFTDFNISGANENPLYVNGTVDVSSMVSPKINLGFKARDMMIVNTNRPSRNAMIYGKGYMSLDATVKGNLNFMQVDADVRVLSGTNITYQFTETAQSLTSLANEDMVKFVNLTDTASVTAADSISSDAMMMALNAQLNIETGTTITVNLPTGARDKVMIQPSGFLTYTMAPMSEGRMTGRINLNSGYASYTIPVIGSEKKFTLNNNSSIDFNGDILNPILNINATDEVKANVTAQGQNSRLVNFDIGLSITGTLDKMDVAFDLSTSDDLTVANELQSMTPEQRANQAMNMLLYNMYTGPGTSANANLAANPLFSFLESQINNWAANNIRGVDLSFGIDQYNQTTNGVTSSTTNYSYQVSKTLFNDRFKVVIGGNYSTDSNADENLAENLINDISFEYFLNKQQTMLIRLFRHVGYASILEGEITQTGVGFVYRKRLNRLVDMLPKIIRPRYKD